MGMEGEMTAEHHIAELLRLRAGYEGCGCVDCQEYYGELDLTKYGERVKWYGNVIIINNGRAGADLWDKYQGKKEIGFLPELSLNPPESPRSLSQNTPPSDFTSAKPLKAKKAIYGTRGRPKKQCDEENILELAKTMTVREVSQKTGVPRSTVSRILNGQKVLL